jgi:raffinose/stachyose/melibiose transport system permease protein
LTDFVGCQPGRRCLDVFTSAVSHNVLIIVLSLNVRSFAFPGLMHNRRFAGGPAADLFAYVISEVITGIVFQLILLPEGLADRTLEGAGLGGFIQGWLADPAIVMLTMFVIITWKYFGFHMIILLAGLQGIPRELEEAAAIDGASHWQSIRRITLPLLGPTIRVSVFLSMIGALQLFDLIWVTTRGGPINASNTMATYMVDWGFRRTQLGYGSAAAVILFLVAFGVALAYQRFVMRRDVEGALTSAEA